MSWELAYKVLTSYVDRETDLAWTDNENELAEYANKLRAENARLTAKLSAAEKIFNHFTFDHLMKMENGEGKTPANLVQEYLEP